LLSYRDELIVPLLAKAFHECFFQKPVYRNVKCPPFVAGTLADVPFVIVQTDGAIAEPLGTDRIEGTAGWLAETGLSCAESLLQGT
jgi:hypothetical protein